MIELLSPAGSPEAVIAAVQNGADAVYLGLGDFNARRGAKNFSIEEFRKAVGYCHIRGCKVYVTLNTLVNDREMQSAVSAGRIASDAGADAILVQDLGLARAIRTALPDIPIHASTQMSIHNLAGVCAAAEMGCTRAVLARELSLEEIKFITERSPIEIEVFVHGALCFCHSGQCYMSSLIGRRSGNRGMCAQPCRMQYSLGGRMDDYPLSLKDSCLVDRLQELEAAGVACVKIEGRMKRPEYSAIVTGIYSKAIKEHKNPSKEDMELLEKAFSRSGFTQGYFDGDKKNMFGTRSDPDKDIEKIFASKRKEYGDGEMRRVPVHFCTLVRQGTPITAIAYDDDGNKAVASGPIPERARNQGVNEAFIIDQMYKTGGTPYYCVDNQAKVEPGLFVASSAVNELRRNLIAELSDRRAEPKKRSFNALPAAPEAVHPIGEPVKIFQIRAAEQLSSELAALKPDYLYVPCMLLAEDYSIVREFVENGTKIVAVLPRIITDGETKIVYEALSKLFDCGVNEALVGNLGHAIIARKAGMKLRGDFGLNCFNSQTMQVLKGAGFISATASFELRIAQIKDMIKPLDTELIVYGRLPVMVSDQCVMSASAGRCTCQQPGQLADRTGNVFPVVKEFGCRNVIYNAHKLFLADKKEELFSAGLWGMRLMFSTENARECIEVAKSHMGLSNYVPNMLTRGLYYRGVE